MSCFPVVSKYWDLELLYELILLTHELLLDCEHWDLELLYELILLEHKLLLALPVSFSSICSCIIC